MLFVFYGSDQKQAEAKFKALTSGLKSKNPKANWFVWDEENFDVGHFRQLVFGQVLFGNHYGVSARRLLSQTEAVDFLINNLQAIIDSKNIFVLLEIDLPKNLIKKMIKTKAQVKEFKLPKENIDSRKSFALTEAFGARDRQSLWLEVIKELTKKTPPEEIFWQLTRIIKNIYLVKTESRLDKLKLHPYYQKKLLAYASRYEAGELVELNSKLGEILYQSRLGKSDLNESLELWALTI